MKFKFKEYLNEGKKDVSLSDLTKLADRVRKEDWNSVNKDFTKIFNEKMMSKDYEMSSFAKMLFNMTKLSKSFKKPEILQKWFDDHNLNYNVKE